MATKGSPVKFVYLQTGVAPASPDANTIYFAPESHSIYVGDVPVVDGITINQNFDTIGQKLEELEQKIGDAIHIEITGSGPVIVDAQFDDDTKTLTITRGSDPDNGIFWAVYDE